MHSIGSPFEAPRRSPCIDTGNSQKQNIWYNISVIKLNDPKIDLGTPIIDLTSPKINFSTSGPDTQALATRVLALLALNIADPIDRKRIRGAM